MPHCVAFGCSNQTKNRKNPKLTFHIFPKCDDLRRAWIQAVGRTSLPKSPRLCSEHFAADCFEDSVRLQTELLGSSPWKRKLKPDAIPTIFLHRPARSDRLHSTRRAEKRQRQEVCMLNILETSHNFACIINLLCYCRCIVIYKRFSSV